MKTRRLILNFSLLLGLGFSFYILIVTILKAEWNTVAGSLAVITAIIGSWITQRIIWKQEDDLEPSVCAYLDLKSRQGIIQFVIENNGGSSAYDVKIVWQKPLYDLKNDEVHFNKSGQDIEIPIINKGQKYSLIVNGTREIYEAAEKEKKMLEYSGYINYKRAKKDKKFQKSEFFLSLEPYRKSLTFETEELNFFHEGAKMHNDLREINKSLQQLVKLYNEKIAGS
jgi:hypothetical protein